MTNFSREGNRPIGLAQQHRPRIRRHQTAVKSRHHTTAIKRFELKLIGDLRWSHFVG